MLDRLDDRLEGGELFSDEFRSIAAGVLVDGAMFAIVATGAMLFITTGSVWSLASSLMSGNVWAREVGNRPGKPRF